MNLILSTIQIITFLLIFQSLITSSISTGSASTAPNIKRSTTQRNTTLLKVVTGTHPTVRVTMKKSVISTRKATTVHKLVKQTRVKPTLNLVTETPKQHKEASYESLYVVGSISGVITIGIIFYVIHVQYFKQSNRLRRETNAENELQLSSISNNNLDIRLGTEYLNKGIIAFNDVSAEIVQNRRT